MRTIRSFVWLALMMILLLSSCSLGETPTPAATEPPSQGTEPPAPSPEPVPTNTEETTLITVDLAGPPMLVGSKYTYVDGTVLVAVPGGPFTMGYNFADNPLRQVSVGDFWVYSTKVTNSQYALCVQQGKCSPPNEEDNDTYGDSRFIKYPVTGVTHAQAADYCSFVHGRLPTEAEWEKTARGPEGNIFPWGDEAPSCLWLNYKYCVGKTTWVNEYKNGVSYYGAFDMSGNAREWAADWYSPVYNIDNPISDPLGPDFGEKRSVRGSSYQDSADPTISAHRFSLDPEATLPDLGFRCVVEDPTYFAPWCEQLTYFGAGLDGSQPDCQPDVDCNTVSISQGLNCTENLSPYTIVEFNVSNTPPNDYTYNLDGCLQDPEGNGSANKFLCYPGGAGSATATGSCLYTAPTSCGTCEAHYNKVGNTCVWDGSGTSGVACLPGSTYDPVSQCCTSITGSGTDFTLCPAGTYPLNGVCVDNPTGVIDVAVADVMFDRCLPPYVGPDDPGDPGDGPGTPGDPGGDPGTSCQEQTCSSTFYSWDATQCCCYNAAKGGCE